MTTIQIKVILVGTMSVGKSTLVERLQLPPAAEISSISNTVGCVFVRITLPSGEDTIKMDVWDTAGQERYKSMCPLYFRKSDLILCVFDVTDESSISSLEDYIKMVAEPYKSQFIFVGNKIDLNPTYDEDHIRNIIQTQLIRPYALQNNSTIVYISALRNLGIRDGEFSLQTRLIDATHEVYRFRILSEEIRRSIDVVESKQKKSCCGRG